MKQTILTTALMLFAAILFAQSTSPQVIATSGSYTNNGTIGLSTTVGEPVTATLSVSGTTLTQGFQQPHYDVISSVLENTNSNLQISVYPNPTENNIYIDISSEQGEEAQLTVTDVLGKLLLNQNLVFNESNSVNLNHLASGQYFFRITDIQGKLLSTHKIQKVN